MENFNTQPKLYNGGFMPWWQQRLLLKKRPRWANWIKRPRWLIKMLKCLFPYHRGFVVDGKRQLSLHDSFGHYLVVGRTGSSKTVNTIYPQLMNLENQSAFVVDPGELSEKLSGFLKQQGHEVYILDLMNPAKSDGFNILDYVKTPSDRRKILHIIITCKLGENPKDPFWNTKAISGLDPLLEALMNQPNPEYKNLANLLYLVQIFGKDGSALDDFIAEYCSERGFIQFQSFVNQNEKTLASVVSTMEAALNLWLDDGICALTAKSTFDFAIARKKPTIVFIKTPMNELSSYKLLIQLIYHFVFKMAMEPPKPNDLPILFLFEEFLSSGVGELPEFQNVCVTVRKNRCAIQMVVQDLQQLHAVLGSNVANSLISGGVNNTLFLNKMSLATAEYLEKIIGRKQTTYTDHQDEMRETVRPVLTADELMILPHNLGVFYQAGSRPALVTLTPYFYQRHLLRRTRFKPVKIINPYANKPIRFIPISPKPEKIKNSPVSKPLSDNLDPRPNPILNGKKFAEQI